MGLRKTIRKYLGVLQLEESISRNTLHLEQEILYRQRELKAMEILKPYLPKDYLFETGFSLPFQLIQHIANDILVRKPSTILELGSGLSTQILSKLIQLENLNIQLISVDNDADWQNTLVPKCPNVDFYAFPLIENSPFSYAKTGSWFGIPAELPWEPQHIDMVIVDGPKGSTCEKARYGFIPFLKGKLGAQPIIYVDDTHRGDERFIADSAAKELHLPQIQYFPRYSRLSQVEDFYSAPA